MQRPASCDFLCGPHTSQQAVTMLREALREGVEKHAEILYYRKDGKERAKNRGPLLITLRHNLTNCTHVINSEIK